MTTATISFNKTTLSSLWYLNNFTKTTKTTTIRRYFETEADYHDVADATLETIQDAIDEALGSSTGSSGNGSNSSNGGSAGNIEYECNLASGVLTLTLPPHGTWVLNKQTPNRQIWWSSPLSGPKRFEYDDDDEKKKKEDDCDGGVWFSTKDGLSLGPLLQQEIAHVTGRTIEIRL